MEDIEIKLENINMSIKVMMIIENCSYRTAQRKLSSQRRMLNKISTSYTALEYCVYNGKNPNAIYRKLTKK